MTCSVFRALHWDLSYYIIVLLIAIIRLRFAYLRDKKDTNRNSIQIEITFQVQDNPRKKV